MVLSIALGGKIKDPHKHKIWVSEDVTKFHRLTKNSNEEKR